MPISASSVYLRNVRLYAYHGVLPQERSVGGWFTLSVEVDCDVSQAANTDTVDDTISYADILTTIKREMAIPSHLLEHVAGRIVEAIANEYTKATAIRLDIVKQNPPMSADIEGAGIRMEWRRT